MHTAAFRILAYLAAAVVCAAIGAALAAGGIAAWAVFG